MESTPRWIASLLALAAGVSAQTYVPVSSAGTGTINSIPLGARGPTGSFQNMRTQIRVPASYLPATGGTVTDIGFAGGGDGSYSYSLFQVSLAHLPGTFGVNFAANLDQPVLAVRRQSTTFPLRLDQWCMAGLTTPFVFDGNRDLIVDIVIQDAVFHGTQPGTRRNNTIQTVYATAYDILNPIPGGVAVFDTAANLVLTVSGGGTIVVGQGCPKADNVPVGIAWQGSPTTPGTLTVTASAAPPGSALALLFGTNDRFHAGLPLPLDLAPLGAPNCLLRTNVLVIFSAVANSGGNANVPFPVPDNPTLRNLPLHFQWVAVAQGSNRLGIVLSAMLKSSVL